MAERPIQEALSEADFLSFIDALKTGDWFNVIFPFMLIYIIIFSVLKNIKLFENKGVRIVISVIISLFSVAFEIPNSGGITLGDFMAELFPGITIVGIAILGLYILLGLFGFKTDSWTALLYGKGKNGENEIKPLGYVFLVISVFVVGYHFFSAAGYLDESGSDGTIGEYLGDPTLWIIIVFGLLFFFLSSDTNGESAEEKRARKAQDTFLGSGGKH